MLISYSFAYIYLFTSLGCFTKDIFVKEICKFKQEDSKIISDIKVTYPVVRNNCIELIKGLACIDLYFYIFGSNYKLR